MIIHGREIRFRFTVGAAEDLSRLCPDGSIANIGKLLSQGSFAARMEATRSFVAILAKGWDDAAAFEAPGTKPQSLSSAELRSLSAPELTKLADEAMAAFLGDQTPTVEVEPEKKAEAPGLT